MRKIASAPVWVLGAILLIALSGVLGGGKAEIMTASAPRADLTVKIPTTMRSGMFFEMQIDADVRSDISDLVIALPPGLWHEMTINTMIPAPEKESHEDGAFRFSYGPFRAGDKLSVKVDGQLNPALTVGTRGHVRLLDGDTPITALPVTIRVFP
ncbi:hypothetical protein [Sphingomonas gilva]|uniref:hypothetical protein n=1 Tax=Sphingomonas gilva TaxID=2305907 RepID=UPI001CA45051|nr:hypothetical protein [Sphingomonas gilva]